MDIPKNVFKRRLLEGQLQYGLWLGLADPISAEICAGAGFDWLLIDAEHGPNELRGILAQLQAVSAYESHPIVRPVEGRTSLIKQLLDIGAQTLLVPMVETAEQAAQLVSALRYPPRGVRGVGTALARAARWNRLPDYFHKAEEEICLIVQIESRAGLDNLTAIAAVEGVDAVFIGPADLAGSLGHLGEPGHPQVVSVIEEALSQIAAAGKASGILAADPKLARKYVGCGAKFVGVGVDTVLLAKATHELAEQFMSS